MATMAKWGSKTWAVSRQKMLRYARGATLDALGENRDVERHTPTPATTTLRFGVSEPVEAAKAETKSALQTVYDFMNNGQQKQIVKVDAVKALFDLYGVNYE